MSRPGRWQKLRERARDAERQLAGEDERTRALLDDIARRLLDAAGEPVPPARGFETDHERTTRVEFHAGRAAGLLAARALVRSLRP